MQKIDDIPMTSANIAESEKGGSDLPTSMMEVGSRIAAEALRRFGKDRASSRSSVHRYIQRYREHLGLASAK